MSTKQLYLIDATAFCYRAFYALPGLATSFGQPTNAIYGFVNILNKVIKDKSPQYLGICFDVSRDTFRQKKFAEYKIQRPPMPDGLVGQMSLIKEIISAFGFTICEKEGFEADDVIAVLARQAQEKGIPTTIVSSDKDILQLVGDGILVFSPYKESGTLYDRKMVIERYGISPEQIPDLIALMGDDADNIPGVPGIGEKTASALIKKFGSLTGLLARIEDIEQPKLKESIKTYLERIKLNTELVVLDGKFDLGVGIEELKIKPQNDQELFRLFKYLEFKKLLKELPVHTDAAPLVKFTRVSDAELTGLIKSGEKLVFYGKDLSDMAFSAGGKVFCVEDGQMNLKNILADPAIKKISHDLKKSKVSLAKQGIALEGLYFDTMIASYLLNPSKPEYTLVELASGHLDKVLDAQQLDNSQFVDIILHLQPMLGKELQEKSLQDLFQRIEMPLTGVLADMELTGITLDVKMLQQLSQDLEKRLIKLIEQIYEVSGCQFNINSPKQMAEVLFTKLKLPVVKKTKTGPSTDEEVLRSLSDKHKLPALLLEYRQLTKLKSTYVDSLPGLVDPQTGKLHTSFNQTGTETGRLSSSNPNLQNLPIKTDIGKQIRKAIKSSGDDNCLISCDYSQIELRILAHLSKDQDLISAFKEGKDIHITTASLIYGVKESEVIDQMREVAKRVNFGIVYGQSAYGLAKDLEISMDDAQAFIDAYFTRYPKVKAYIEEQIKKAEVDGFVTTILGRRRYIPQIKEKNQAIRQFAQRQAVNTPIQGSASDLIKLAMIEIDGHLQDEKRKTKMVLQIHDELVFDVPGDELEAVTRMIRDRMENVLQLDVPIKVSIKKGNNWLEMEDIIQGGVK